MASKAVEELGLKEDKNKNLKKHQRHKH